jgi:FlaA1/EpsC-like NDP-sugar epimerase
MMPNNTRRTALQKATVLFDLGVVSFTMLVALAVSTGAFTWPSLAYVLEIRIALANLVLFAAFLAVCWAIFSSCGLYRSHRLSQRPRRLGEIFLAVTVISVLILILRGPLDLSFATDIFLLVFWLLTFGFLALFHEIAQQVLYYARFRGRNLRNIVIVGEGKEANDLAERIEENAALGYRVLRIIDVKEIQQDEPIADRFGT